MLTLSSYGGPDGHPLEERHQWIKQIYYNYWERVVHSTRIECYVRKCVVSAKGLAYCYGAKSGNIFAISYSSAVNAFQYSISAIRLHRIRYTYYNKSLLYFVKSVMEYERAF